MYIYIKKKNSKFKINLLFNVKFIKKKNKKIIK
jgi:hypothetical protein